MGKDNGKSEQLKRWESECWSLGIEGLVKLGEELGAGKPYFNWEAARTVEGFYRVKGGVKFCAQRAKAYGKYADLIWMETAKPGLNQATEFSKDVLGEHPNLMLAYNQSPSFNWDASGLTDAQMRTYISDLAKLGYAWQFITLAGFHSDALGISRFARAYKTDEMLAYVTQIQRAEREEDVSTLTHQKWSGSELVDATLSVVTSGMTSTSIMSAGVTEAQFAAKLEGRGTRSVSPRLIRFRSRVLRNVTPLCAFSARFGMYRIRSQQPWGHDLSPARSWRRLAAARM